MAEKIPTNARTEKFGVQEGKEGFILAGRNNKRIRVGPAQVNGNDVSVANMRDTVVWIRGTPNTLHLVDLTGCTVLSGPVTTSAFADRCVNSNIALACQLLRLNDCRDLRVYSHVTSRSIIEDSSDIHVAPYNWSYENLESDFESAGLDREVNRWDQIEDFYWLKDDEPSPNWSVLAPEKRVEDWEAFLRPPTPPKKPSPPKRPPNPLF